MHHFFKISTYFAYYSRTDKRPSYFHVFFLLPFFLRHPKINIPLFKRFKRANSLPNDSVLDDLAPPQISCLLVITRKDFVNLPDCVNGLVNGSKNPIAMFYFVTPSKYKAECNTLVQGILPTSKYEIYSDESIMPKNVMNRLREKFGSNFGWVLQQFLTVGFVMNSKDAGILAIDGDTVLLRPQIWLTNEGKQTLMVSSEYHSAYYELLSKIDSKFSSVTYSFITHHMLFQPVIMRSILAKIGVDKIDDLADLIFRNVDSNRTSPLCIEFEIYAQSMLLHFPDKISLTRFSNIPVALPEENDLRFRKIEYLKSKSRYNSISAHTWIPTNNQNEN